MTEEKKYVNHLAKVDKLRNTYFVMRHGISNANMEGIIVSSPEKGVEEYGLTGSGLFKVEKMVIGYQIKGILNRNIVIYTSDFKRAKRTAKKVRTELRTEKVITRTELRERYFGEFDGRSNKFYETVWKADKEDSSYDELDIESVDSVLDRTTDLIVKLEKKHKERKILLVSHGDPLHILQTAFERIDSSKHMDLDSLALAEIRKLELKPLE